MRMVNLGYNDKLVTANPALKTLAVGMARSAVLGRTVAPILEAWFEVVTPIIEGCR